METKDTKKKNTKIKEFFEKHSPSAIKRNKLVKDTIKTIDSTKYQDTEGLKLIYDIILEFSLEDSSLGATIDGPTLNRYLDKVEMNQQVNGGEIIPAIIMEHYRTVATELIKKSNAEREND